MQKKQKLSILVSNIPEKEANWLSLIRFLPTPINYGQGYILMRKIHQEEGYAVLLVANSYTTFY